MLPSMRPAVVARCWVGAAFQAAWWLELPAQSRPSAEAVAGEVAEFNLRGIGADVATLAAAQNVPAVRGEKESSP